MIYNVHIVDGENDYPIPALKCLDDPTVEGFYWALDDTEWRIVEYFDGRIRMIFYENDCLPDRFFKYIGPLPVPPLPVKEVTG